MTCKNGGDAVPASLHSHGEEESDEKEGFGAWVCSYGTAVLRSDRAHSAESLLACYGGLGMGRDVCSPRTWDMPFLSLPHTILLYPCPSEQRRWEPAMMGAGINLPAHGCWYWSVF